MCVIVDGSRAIIVGEWCFQTVKEIATRLSGAKVGKVVPEAISYKFVLLTTIYMIYNSQPGIIISMSQLFFKIISVYGEKS